MEQRLKIELLKAHFRFHVDPDPDHRKTTRKLKFIKIISHNKQIGYNINVLQQTACLVVKPITVGNFPL